MSLVFNSFSSHLHKLSQEFRRIDYIFNTNQQSNQHQYERTIKHEKNEEMEAQRKENIKKIQQRIQQLQNQKSEKLTAVQRLLQQEERKRELQELKETLQRFDNVDDTEIRPSTCSCSRYCFSNSPSLSFLLNNLLSNFGEELCWITEDVLKIAKQNHNSKHQQSTIKQVKLTNASTTLQASG